MSTYIVTFEVTGRIPFPLDMLRYDSCFPVRGEDAGMIERSFERAQRREVLAELPERCFRVRLEHVGYSPWLPTTGRWESFLWSVDSQTVKAVRS